MNDLIFVTVQKGIVYAKFDSAWAGSIAVMGFAFAFFLFMAKLQFMYLLNKSRASRREWKNAAKKRYQYQFKVVVEDPEKKGDMKCITVPVGEDFAIAQDDIENQMKNVWFWNWLTNSRYTQQQVVKCYEPKII